MREWHWWVIYALVFVAGVLIGHYVIPWHGERPVLR